MILSSFDEIPKKTYQIIYADPPWEVKKGPPWRSSGKSLSLDYPTLSIDDICNLKVNDIVDYNSCLYLWVINKYIEQAYYVSRSWGFKPICLLTWCKSKHGLGLGGTYVQTSEHLLYCRKNQVQTMKRIDTTWFQYKRQKLHSQKPTEIRDMIVDVHGDLPRIELFARQKISGWDIWGNELENSFEYKFKGSNECRS